jgi:S1-C subfamily serine protease
MFDPYADNEARPYVDNKNTAAFRSTQEQVPWSNSPAPDQWTVPNSPTPEPGRISSPPPIAPVPSRPRSKGLRTGAIFVLTLVLVIVFGVGLFAGWQFGRTSTSTLEPNVGQLQPGTGGVATVPPLTANNEDTVREAVIAKVRPAVVEVNVTLGNGAGIGSGVIIDRRGYIVTNNHVVNGAQTITVVLYDGTRLTGQLVGTDPADDLAVVKINTSKNLTVATLADSSKLRVGQEVLAIGNPLGITQTVTNGIISALGRSVSEGQGGATIPDAIQTDAPINPGNSGGALVDMQGNLVGIPTLTAIDPEFNTPASGVGFAIPSNRVNFIVPQIIANGSVTHTGRAVLGVQVQDVDSTLAAQDNLSVDHGVYIGAVVPNSAADHAGLQVGDVIVQIDNNAINDLSSLSDYLATKNPGDKVAVHIYRGSQQLTVNVTLGELQAGG